MKKIAEQSLFALPKGRFPRDILASIRQGFGWGWQRASQWFHLRRLEGELRNSKKFANWLKELHCSNLAEVVEADQRNLQRQIADLRLGGAGNRLQADAKKNAADRPGAEATLIPAGAAR